MLLSDTLEGFSDNKGIELFKFILGIHEKSLCQAEIQVLRVTNRYNDVKNNKQITTIPRTNFN